MMRLFFAIWTGMMTVAFTGETPSKTWVVHVFSEAVYSVEWTEKGWLSSSTVQDVEHRRNHGSGFVVMSGTRCFVITAGHVVVGDHPVKGVMARGQARAIDTNTKLVKQEHRMRFDETSLVPAAIAIDIENDLALIEVKDLDVPLLTAKAKIIDLSTAVQPKAQGKIRAWGFPGTSEQQASGPAEIMAVQSNFFVVSSRMDPGSSGGLALNEEQSPMGVVLRSDEKQARLAPISNVRAMLERYDLLRIPYPQKDPDLINFDAIKAKQNQ